jgi:hypothetical protein
VVIVGTGSSGSEPPASVEEDVRKATGTLSKQKVEMATNRRGPVRFEDMGEIITSIPMLL